MEPIGEYRQDYMMGQITALIYNLAQCVYGDKKAVKKSMRAEDFIPWMKLGKSEVAEEGATRGLSSPEDIKALFQSPKTQQEKKRS